jgi:LysM repeat protein
MRPLLILPLLSSFFLVSQGAPLVDCDQLAEQNHKHRLKATCRHWARSAKKHVILAKGPPKARELVPYMKYTSQKDDTCSMIATAYGVPLQVLQAHNPAINCDKSPLSTGTKLRVPVMNKRSHNIKHKASKLSAVPEETQWDFYKEARDEEFGVVMDLKDKMRALALDA